MSFCNKSQEKLGQDGEVARKALVGESITFCATNSSSQGRQAAMKMRKVKVKCNPDSRG